MNRETSVGELLATLKTEIAERQQLVDALEARVGPEVRGSRGMGAAAVEILRAAGRPMHGIRDILPALEAQGYRLPSKAGFATTLMRTGQIVRVAPGTFAYEERREKNDAEANA